MRGATAAPSQAFAIWFSTLKRAVDDEEKDERGEQYKAADHPESRAKVWFVAWRLSGYFDSKRMSWCFHSLYMTGKGYKGNSVRAKIIDNFVRKMIDP